jgi:small subunit ribosomal protein S6
MGLVRFFVAWAAHTEERSFSIMRDYELTYIIKPDLDPAALASVIERVSGFVTVEGGGTISKTTPWGMRQLAYPIRRYREGQYVFSLIQIEPTAMARIEQRLRMNEDVLRFLLVRAEDAAGEPVAEDDVMGGAEVVETPEAELAVESAAAPEATAEAPAVSVAPVDAPADAASA